jgi:hypothetical protein
LEALLGMIRIFLLLTVGVLFLTNNTVNAQTTTNSSNSSSFCTMVGETKDPSPCINQSNKPTDTKPTGTLASVLDWDTKIVDKLERGIWTYLNKLSTSITNGTYSTGTWAGTNDGTVYWCTYSIADAYNLAGITGLSKSSHAAVVNMRIFWKKQQNGFLYVDYQGNNQKLTDVKPGYAIFMEFADGQFLSKEHVAMVKEIRINEKGNGTLITQDSNSSAKTRNYDVKDLKILGTPYPVRGFGGI